MADGISDKKCSYLADTRPDENHKKNSQQTDEQIKIKKKTADGRSDEMHEYLKDGGPDENLRHMAYRGWGESVKKSSVLGRPRGRRKSSNYDRRTVERNFLKQGKH